MIGMAHRGRLNVLVNVLGKVPEVLFSEFEGTYDLKKLKGSGDVKYHKGFSSDVCTPSGNVHLALALQSFAPRGREPGGRRLGAGATGTPRRRGSATR